MNPNVDIYLEEGCGRCAHYKTPQCKVHTWKEELIELRRIVLESGLKEEYKWSQPCYTFKDNNVLIVTAFKDYAALSFFKGVLLKDKKELLLAPGKSSQSVRYFRFTEFEDILKKEAILKSYMAEAIENEKKGLKVEFKKNLEPMPEELEYQLEMDPELRKAFDELTPGRRRGYIIHFSQAKKSETRLSRIEKCIPQILQGIGLHDHYKSKKG